ncbi:MAG: hypothetical protein V3581_00390 [Candidatus Cardinium sp.]|uniref:hypothetical protein n=1 Tax=Candidatus Cardinium sp. TP TaxID=2961955 RepID=UPI0021B059F4|nr:hypothetical protein [Candidatus Cardinium sp. TP]MDN5246734.1 hypothetical protein [Candidatus Cardinium sp.]
MQAVLKHYASDVCAGDRDGYLKKVMHLVVDKCKDKPAQCNEVKMVEVLLDSEIIPVNELDENDLTLLRKAGLFVPHLLPTLAKPFKG